MSIDKKPLQSFEKKISFKNEIRASRISSDLVALQNETVNSFLKKVVFWCFRILQYENYELQKKALNLVPLTELNLNVIKNIRKIQLEYKKKNISGEIIDFQELLLIELCNWFNTEFFTWVDTPQCTKCGFIETVHDGMSYEVIPGADRVEV